MNQEQADIMIERKKNENKRRQLKRKIKTTNPREAEMFLIFVFSGFLFLR